MGNVVEKVEMWVRGHPARRDIVLDIVSGRQLISFNSVSLLRTYKVCYNYYQVWYDWHGDNWLILLPPPQRIGTIDTFVEVRKIHEALEDKYMLSRMTIDDCTAFSFE